MDPIRIAKAEELRKSGKQPYGATFDRSHSLLDAKNASDGTQVKVAGRLMLLREMGKLTFATLQDQSGRLQIAFRQEDFSEEEYAHMRHILDLGDIIGIAGERFATQRGEPTVRVTKWEMLTKAVSQPPEKWHGIADQETAWRQRYLDLMSNEDVMERFKFRAHFVQKMREFYWEHDFMEMETPVLVNAASGALATPFQTHHEAFDMDVFLRIAPETFLKECLVGGFDRVFEIARVFRNEGIDPSHLQDFTMAEHYAAYWDYEANMKFTEEMLSSMLKETLGTTIVDIPDRDGNMVKVDFTPPWPRLSIRDAIQNAASIDIGESNSASALREAMKKQSIKLDVDVSKLGFGNLVDQLYKKVSRPDIVQPTFLTEHPVELSPLARRNDVNPDIVDRFQLVVGGWEIVNAYSELIDPVDQNQRFEEQAALNAGGDDDAHGKDDSFVKALSYGCPPCSGWGMGIDRIVTLLTRQTNLRDVVLFPLMKPRKDAERLGAARGEQSELYATDDRVHAAQPKSLESDGDHLLEHADYGHLLEGAHGLLDKYTDQTRAHLVATGAAMEALAKKFGGNEQTWKVAGMLHDLDWDNLEKDYEKHCGTTLQQMLSEIDAPEELLGDIRAHYAHKYGEDYPLNSMLRKCLYCVDELTGFIIAVALVRPSKSIGDVEVKSVKKKLKDKSFAAQVDREQIGKCDELLGIPLEEMIQIVLDAMKPHAEEMGL